MRKTLGTYLFGGSGALFLGLVPSLVGGGDAVVKWVLVGLVVLGIITGLIVRPWKETEGDRRLRESNQAKIAAATQQELMDVEKNLARLRHAQLTPTLDEIAQQNSTNLSLGVASRLIAEGRNFVNQQRLESELREIEIARLEEKRKALQKVVEG